MTTIPVRIPVLLHEEVPTLDFRTIQLGAVTARELPLPILAVIDGDAVAVGQIEGIDRVPDGGDTATWTATGTISDKFAAGMPWPIPVGADLAVSAFGEWGVVRRAELVGATVSRTRGAWNGSHIERTDQT